MLIMDRPQMALVFSTSISISSRLYAHNFKEVIGPAPV